ncbi:hypothetical protein NPIL_2781 [Nephila pilipes]|uniref:Uncharacterized protein n=1 Tax=Nephila pilipes TaxID=299642 RepID=A0A8X6TSF6_NEPPI|nr:hypothetical protein NPIL_2781 [Nephila pilipes]
MNSADENIRMRAFPELLSCIVYRSYILDAPLTSLSKPVSQYSERIHYIVKNYGMEIFFLFNQEFSEFSREISDETVPDFLDKIVKEFQTEMTVYEFMWLLIVISCYTAIIKTLRDSVGKFNGTRYVFDSLRRYLNVTDLKWTDVDEATKQIEDDIKSYNQKRNAKN